MKSMDVIKTVASNFSIIMAKSLLCFSLMTITTLMFSNEECIYDLAPCLCPDGKTPGYCTFNEKNVLYCECNHVFPD